MRDKELYKQILGIHGPWHLADVELSVEAGEVRVYVERSPGGEQRCPKCGKVCPGYDSRRRQWRHLNTCQFKTLLVAEVPRVECPEHGVVTVDVPWSERGSGFTALFEALVVDWLREASVAAVSRRVNLSWNAIDGIMQRAVQRGLARRAEVAPAHIGIDETSFRKRHAYVTVVSDQDSGTVVHVADERDQDSLAGFYRGLSVEQKASIESVAMDTWPAYIRATLDAVPEAHEKVAFDKFHVAKYLGDAVDKVRRTEHRALPAEGRDELTRTKHQWLMNPRNMSAG